MNKFGLVWFGLACPGCEVSEVRLGLDFGSLLLRLGRASLYLV